MTFTIIPQEHPLASADDDHSIYAGAALRVDNILPSKPRIFPGAQGYQAGAHTLPPATLLAAPRILIAPLMRAGSQDAAAPRTSTCEKVNRHRRLWDSEEEARAHRRGNLGACRRRATLNDIAIPGCGPPSFQMREVEDRFFTPRGPFPLFAVIGRPPFPTSGRKTSATPWGVFAREINSPADRSRLRAHRQRCRSAGLERRPQPCRCWTNHAPAPAFASPKPPAPAGGSRPTSPEAEKRAGLRRTIIVSLPTSPGRSCQSEVTVRT